MTRKIYVVGGDDNYMNWMDGEAVDNMKDADLVVFTGGSDVSPALYGKDAHPTTGPYPKRDRMEMIAFSQAKLMELPIIGICRGAQLLCVLNGGILVQDQTHPFMHPIVTNDGREFLTSSTHHQRAFLQEMDKDELELIAWAEHLSPYSFGESDQDKMIEEKEAEIVFYKKTRSLGIQGHPEMLYPAKELHEVNFINYCKELLVKYLEV